MCKSRTDFFKQKIYHFDLWKKLNVIKLGVPKKLSFWIIWFRRKNCNSYTWKCFFYILHSSYKCCQIAYHRRVFRAPSNSQEWKLCKLRLSKIPECYFLCSRLSFLIECWDFALRYIKQISLWLMKNRWRIILIANITFCKFQIILPL